MSNVPDPSNKTRPARAVVEPISARQKRYCGSEIVSLPEISEADKQELP
jgi:hypothetical protein